MQKRFRIASFTVVALSALAFAVRADDEKKISAENLPAAIKQAIKKKFKNAEIEKATKEVEDGKTTYEVLLEIDDRPVDVAFGADGAILEIERVIPLEKVPARVKKALAKNYPSARVTRVEAVTRGEDGPTVYEFAINADVVIDARGELVKATQENDETPSAKEKKPKKDDDDEDEKSEKSKTGKKSTKGHED